MQPTTSNAMPATPPNAPRNMGNVERWPVSEPLNTGWDTDEAEVLVGGTVSLDSAT